MNSVALLAPVAVLVAGLLSFFAVNAALNSMGKRRNSEKGKRSDSTPVKEMSQDADDRQNGLPFFGWFQAFLQNNMRARLPEGWYWVDTATRGESTIHRAAMLVRHHGENTTFRRFEHTGENTKSWWHQFSAVHQGIVLEKRGNFYFVALNELGSKEPSMMVFRYATTSELMMVGNASVRGPGGPTIMAAVISVAPSSKGKFHLIRAARSYGIDSPFISVAVVDLLQAEHLNIADNYGWREPPSSFHTLPSQTP